MHSNISCNYILQQPITSQGWLLYAYSIQISVMLKFQSPLCVNLHVWLEILWVKLFYHLGSISTWYQSLSRSISLLPYCYCRFDILTGSTFCWLEVTIFELWTNLRRDLDSIQFLWVERWDGDIFEREMSLHGYYGNWGRSQCSCKENQIAQQEGWGLWSFVSEHFKRPPLPYWWIDIN